MARLCNADARRALAKIIPAVSALEDLLPENLMFFLNSAIHCYAQHPEDHSCDEDLDYAGLFATTLAMSGYNDVLPEHSFLKDWEFPEDG